MHTDLAVEQSCPQLTKMCQPCALPAGWLLNGWLLHGWQAFPGEISSWLLIAT